MDIDFSKAKTYLNNYDNRSDIVIHYSGDRTYTAHVSSAILGSIDTKTHEVGIAICGKLAFDWGQKVFTHYVLLSSINSGEVERTPIDYETYTLQSLLFPPKNEGALQPLR